MRNRFIWIAGMGALLTLSPTPAHPQAGAADSATVYRREVFRYARAGRPDPFRSLVRDAEVGVRLEDLSVRGIMYHPDPGRSVAMLARAGVSRPLRVRVGDRIGGVRIVAIRPTRVQVVIEEPGVARPGSLELKPAPKKGESR